MFQPCTPNSPETTRFYYLTLRLFRPSVKPISFVFFLQIPTCPVVLLAEKPYFAMEIAIIVAANILEMKLKIFTFRDRPHFIMEIRLSGGVKRLIWEMSTKIDLAMVGRY